MSVDKLKFSIKASLSLALVVLLSFSLGWTQVTPALVTIMIIASVGSVGDSMSKGLLRVIGTVIGAIIGMILIAIFPQDRELYLVSLSILVSIILYLARAYRGDNSIFMLSAVTMMMMFNNGAVEDSFMYGIEKTFMTVFGITIYTLVGIFLWTISFKEDTIDKLSALNLEQKIFFESLQEKDTTQLWQDLLVKESALISANLKQSTNELEENFTDAQWLQVIAYNKKINKLLLLLSHYKKENRIEENILNYNSAKQEILLLFDTLIKLGEGDKEIAITKSLEIEYAIDTFEELSPIEKASVLSMGYDLEQLHKNIRELALLLQSSMSAKPTLFDIEVPKSSLFVWGDIEDIKGTFISFLIFWLATFLWIEYNPPAGFMIVTLATAMSILTTFTAVKPSLLMIVFSISFLFASFMYIGVLPNLHYAWELGLFIFIYGMIGFYLMPAKLSLFFLLGIITLGLANEMNYNFAIFLLTLFIFYAFLSLLLLFYYIPFSTKAEDMFVLMKMRFFRLLENSMQDRGEIQQYSLYHLLPTVTKMQFWSEQIERKQLDFISYENIQLFVNESQKLVYLVILMQEYTAENKKSKIEEIFFDTLDFSEYTNKEIALFYKVLTLKNSIAQSRFTCECYIQKIDFQELQLERF